MQVSRNPLLWPRASALKGFRAHLTVENQVILGHKSVERVTGAHKKQVLTYLRLTGMKLGLLSNSVLPTP